MDDTGGKLVSYQSPMATDLPLAACSVVFFFFPASWAHATHIVKDPAFYTQCCVINIVPTLGCFVDAVFKPL